MTVERDLLTGERDLSETLKPPEQDGERGGDFLGDETVAGPAATSGVAPFHCIMVIMVNMSNNSAWFNVLGID